MTSEDSSTSPLDLILEVSTAFNVSRSLHVVAQMGVADSVGDGPRVIAEVAADVGANADALRRILRLLASYAIFAIDEGFVSHTPASELLRSDHPQSIRNVVRLLGSQTNWRAWEQLAWIEKLAA